MGVEIKLMWMHSAKEFVCQTDLAKKSDFGQKMILEEGNGTHMTHINFSFILTFILI